VNKKRLIPIVVILIALVIGVRYWQSEQEQTADPNTLDLYGNVDIREVRLAFNGNEHVGEILIEEGDRVVAGQLLARLHTDLWVSNS
jgi:HlyD family secretion protein